MRKAALILIAWLRFKSKIFDLEICGAASSKSDHEITTTFEQFNSSYERALGGGAVQRKSVPENRKPTARGNGAVPSVQRAHTAERSAQERGQDGGAHAGAAAE